VVSLDRALWPLPRLGKDALSGSPGQRYVRRRGL